MSGDKFYKCLGNDIRLRCLVLLVSREALCVCDIAEALCISQPMTSRHLARLRACNLVSDHREGHWVYYRLHTDLKTWQKNVLTATLKGVGVQAPYREDLQRLQALELNKRVGDCR
ncbi:MAG: metalloregulator ArsR/SmtB family transcription factor [Pseudohongiellaceae bacterium]